MEPETEGLQDIAPESGSPRMLTQEEVNALVGREKHAASERTRRELEAAHQAQIAKLQGGVSRAQQPLSEDELYERLSSRFKQENAASQEAQNRAAHEAYLSERGDSYFNKMKAAQNMPEDFKQVTDDFDLENLPDIAFLAEEVENTPDVMYELAKHPLKAAGIMALAHRSTKEARKAVKKLSESIVKNQQAQDEHVSTPAPLSQLKPSKAGADTGKMTLQDFKNASWLKF